MIKREDFNPENHDLYKGLTVWQPYADRLVRPAYVKDGVPYAEKQIEVRGRITHYRGDLLICSSKTPKIAGHDSGVTCGLVELYAVKPASEFTEEEWELTTIPKEQRDFYRNGYGWMMRNPRRVVEMPVKGKLGIYDIVLPKDSITEYPLRITIDEKDWRIIKAKANAKI